MPTTSPISQRPVIVLAIVALVTTCCTRISNRVIADALGAPWIANTCIAAILVAVGIYMACRPVKPFALWEFGTSSKRALRLAFGWLAVWVLSSFAYAFYRGSWEPYTTGAPALLGFLLLGPVTEELLFRGAVFELSERVWPQVALAPILVSSIFFSAYHLQLHAYRVNSFVLFQLALTLVLGLVLARLRALSGSLWPGLAVHIATNLPHAFGPFPSAA